MGSFRVVVSESQRECAQHKPETLLLTAGLHQAFTFSIM